MHVSSAPQLNQKLSVASVVWWINPTHSHKCNYFIGQCLGRPHWALCTQSFQQKKWMERTPHHFTLLFISCRICPVQLNYKYNHSVRAKVIPLSIPFGPWRTLQAGYEFHIKVACTPIHTHLHPNTHTQFITLQHSTKEGHALFNNMLTSIKEGSHKKNESFLFFILLTSQLLRWGWRVVDICCYGCCCGKVVIIRRVFWVFLYSNPILHREDRCWQAN